jgi:hypothetical protein
MSAFMVDQAGVPGDPKDDKLSRQQLELALRRAAEIERREGAPGDMIAISDAERIAAEAGLSPQAVRQALAEVRTGALTPPSVFDRVLGPRRLVVERVVPGPIEFVRRQVDRFFKDQLMRVKRNFGDRIVWEPAAGFATAMVRAFDWNRQYAIGQGLEIECEVAEQSAGPPPRVTVRFLVDVGIQRRHRMGQIAGGAVLGGAMAAGAVPLVGHLLYEIIAIAGGGTMAVAAVMNARSSFRRDNERVKLALDRFLDSLEHP